MFPCNITLLNEVNRRSWAGHSGDRVVLVGGFWGQAATRVHMSLVQSLFIGATILVDTGITDHE